jgi:glutamate dehydrogenase
MEGLHLRGARVARGGLRWSERPEDFRTEVLGLVKAQMVKNAVIVPAGAKGAFVVRGNLRGLDRAAVQERVAGAYRTFVDALLDVTDDRVTDDRVTDDRGGDRVVHPARTVVHDGPDPYLVVAADKGTATFSDLANEVAERRGFWLGRRLRLRRFERLRPQGHGHHRPRAVGVGAPAPARARRLTPTGR